jgi:hypothetical protein
MPSLWPAQRRPESVLGRVPIVTAWGLEQSHHHYRRPRYQGRICQSSRGRLLDSCGSPDPLMTAGIGLTLARTRQIRFTSSSSRSGLLDMIRGSGVDLSVSQKALLISDLKLLGVQQGCELPEHLVLVRLFRLDQVIQLRGQIVNCLLMLGHCRLESR